MTFISEFTIASRYHDIPAVPPVEDGEITFVLMMVFSWM